MAKGNIIGNLWRPKTEAQKKAGMVASGSIDGVRISIWNRKEKREGKNDSDFVVIKDENQAGKSAGRKPAPEKADKGDEW